MSKKVTSAGDKPLPYIPSLLALHQAEENTLLTSTQKVVWVRTYGSAERYKGQSELTRRGYIGIGWPEGGDFTRLDTREEVWAVLEKRGKPARARLHKRDAGIIHKFMRIAQIGDVVVTRNHEEKSVYVGTIVGPYIYDAIQDGHFHSLRKVEWSYNVPPDTFSSQSLNLINKQGVFWQMRGNASEYLKRYVSPSDI